MTHPLDYQTPTLARRDRRDRRRRRAGRWATGGGRCVVGLSVGTAGGIAIGGVAAVVDVCMARSAVDGAWRLLVAECVVAVGAAIVVAVGAALRPWIGWLGLAAGVVPGVIIGLAAAVVVAAGLASALP